MDIIDQHRSTSVKRIFPSPIPFTNLRLAAVGNKKYYGSKYNHCKYVQASKIEYGVQIRIKYRT